ncbi:MAG: NAD-dependent epimerase/dehydratase family protein [Planctomycetota bacterium]
MQPDFWSELHGEAFAGVPVLVTGGAGFIGSHLSEALVALGADVRVFDNLSEGDRDNLPDGVELIEGDLLDADAVKDAAMGRRTVFHLAALVSVPRSVLHPAEYHTVNATGTLNVLEAARLGGVQRVVYSASSSAYGDSEVLPKVETMPPAPRSPYAATKLAGEELVRSYAHCYDLDTAALRYFNIFGPRQKADSAYAGVVAAFAKALLNGEHPKIYGDGTASRDFTFVANVAHANLLAGRFDGRLNGGLFNVATGVRHTINALAETMARLIGKSELTPVHGPERAGDVMHSLADLEHSRSVLGYEPVVPFDDGMRKTVAWYAEQFGKTTEAEG